jgi:peptidoglycan/xylan/chitin deacetylase (PgdA/CDA1 family)
MRRAARRAGAAAALFAFSCTAAAAPCGNGPGDKPVYLTFDTGHMGVAPLVADVLTRHAVKATFFLADERTLDGGSSLDDRWAPWWKARASEGHAFGSHTWSHVVWLADERGGFRMRPTAGAEAGKARHWTSAEYCAEIERPAQRFAAMTGGRMLPVFRAPGGKTSPSLLATAKACGWAHAGWSPAGFLGDELPSDRYPNAQLLERALREIRAGDILLAHLGIWSRKDPWAPAVLEPLIAGLKQRGFCFATLRENPAYRDPPR